LKECGYDSPHAQIGATATATPTGQTGGQTACQESGPKAAGPQVSRPQIAGPQTSSPENIHHQIENRQQTDRIGGDRRPCWRTTPADTSIGRNRPRPDG
jgi:transcription elongation factor